MTLKLSLKTIKLYLNYVLLEVSDSDFLQKRWVKEKPFAHTHMPWQSTVGLFVLWSSCKSSIGLKTPTAFTSIRRPTRSFMRFSTIYNSAIPTLLCRRNENLWNGVNSLMLISKFVLASRLVEIKCLLSL